jgi:hypothetical protein
MLDPYVKPLSSGSVLPWLTADRIVTTNSLSQLATPSSISSPQSLTLSGPATATVAGLLTAQSSLTVASTATLQGVTTVVDGNFSILGSSDPTKTIKFEVDAQTTADDLTINSGAQTDDRTLTVPVLTGNRTLAVIDQAQTFSAVQTISATAGLLLTAATGTSLNVSSSDNSATLASNSIFTAGGLGVTSDITVGGFLRTNTDTRVYSGASLTLWGKSSGANGAIDAASGSLLLQSGSSTRITMTSSLTTMLNPMVCTLGTATSSSPFISGTQTWNSGATSFNGFTFLITDTASAAGSLLMYFEVSGAAKFTIGKTGSIMCAGTINAPAATTSIASLNIPHGTAPSSPTNGDMWTTTAGLFVRINGVTVGPLS